MPFESNIYSKIRIFGERLGVISLEDDELITEGDIVTPDSAQKQHYFVRVVAKGDGMFKGIEQHTRRSLPDVNVGDIVMVQVQPAMARDAAIDIGNQKVVVIHWGDAICRIIDEEKPVSSHNVMPVGKWVFTESKKSNKVGDLYIPDTSREGELTTSFVAAGKLTDIDLTVGKRVYLNMARANPFRLGDMTEPEIVLTMSGSELRPVPRVLDYVDASFVMGYVE